MVHYFYDYNKALSFWSLDVSNDIKVSEIQENGAGLYYYSSEE